MASTGACPWTAGSHGPARPRRPRPKAGAPGALSGSLRPSPRLRRREGPEESGLSLVAAGGL